jgi:hypothetical protein
LQFWLIKLRYQDYEKATSGYHSWSSAHDLAVLIIVGGLNAVVAAMIGRLLRAESRSVRIIALLGLGFQFGSLLISAETLGLRRISL